ncbi:MAG: VCBS repeat-containing protein [Bacillota bacterium]|nr:VCBS repeat-containing protein [Bacillota bacterium]
MQKKAALAFSLFSCLVLPVALVVWLCHGAVGFYTVSARPALEKTAESRSFDLDRDGQPECYDLRKGRLTITGQGRITWQSPAEWRVTAFALGDANNDGIDDLNLVLWKKGSFGRDKPFWVTGSDEDVKNHLFIYDLAHGSLKPVWLSSNLDAPILELSIEDVDGDGKNELLVVEGDYTSPSRQKTVWQWNGWGFTLTGSPCTAW